MTAAGASPRLLLSAGAVLLVVAIVLGGGGSPSPSQELVVQAAALVAVVVATTAGWRPFVLVGGDVRFALVAAAIAMFPLVQLVPLPPQIWHAMPGRDGAQAALAAAGLADGWRPWSVLPDGGIAAALALIPAAVGLGLAASLPPAGRVRLLGVLAAGGLVAALFGIVQFVAGDSRALSFYAESHRGWATGFFANRNAQADFVAIALVAGLLLVGRWRGALSVQARWALGLAGLLMLAGGVATGSRMGMLVLGVPVALAIGMAGRRAPLAAAALGGGALLLLAGGTALDRVTARAGDAGNRTDIWGDSVFVAAQVAPIGAGMGSFQPLYTAAERLDHVQPTIANRAHNDYLELAIEGGVPALALLAALLAFVARRCVAGWRDPDPDRRVLVRFAGLSTVILAVHSTVDYPLRNLTLLTVAALALAGLARGGQGAFENKMMGSHA